jgi:hypothetical protein
MLIVLIVIVCILLFIAIYLVKINNEQKEFKETREFYIKAIDQNARLTAYFLETPEYKEMRGKAIQDEFEAVLGKPKKKSK